jgi:hypothetical protein
MRMMAVLWKKLCPWIGGRGWEERTLDKRGSFTEEF